MGEWTDRRTSDLGLIAMKVEAAGRSTAKVTVSLDLERLEKAAEWYARDERWYSRDERLSPSARVGLRLLTVLTGVNHEREDVNYALEAAVERRREVGVVGDFFPADGNAECDDLVWRLPARSRKKGRLRWRVIDGDGTVRAEGDLKKRKKGGLV